MAKKKSPAQHFAALFELWMRGATDGEKASAKKKVDAWLKRHGKTDGDIGAILAQARNDEAASQPPQPKSDPRNTGADPYAGTDFNVADLVHSMIERYIGLELYEYDAVTLWVIHTHVYERFMFTPRLLLTSPTKGHGKTTHLDVLSSLVARAHRSDSVTAAVLYHCINKLRSTMLLDEADNLNLQGKDRHELRKVLNAGYRRGGAVDRLIKNVPTSFDVFAPIALAGIGFLPPPLMSRCIVVHMRKHDDWLHLHRFDRNDAEAMSKLDEVYIHVRHWCASAQLDANPPEAP
jgi:hypothetical protein